jgi:hypothetical protein
MSHVIRPWRGATMESLVGTNATPCLQAKMLPILEFSSWNHHMMLALRMSCPHVLDAGSANSSAQDRSPLARPMRDLVTVTFFFVIYIKINSLLSSGAQCIYETRRNKPGLKSGVVEHLNQRLCMQPQYLMLVSWLTKAYRKV